MIISSMQKHSDHAGVQEQACGALANLGVHQQNMVTWQDWSCSFQGVASWT